MRWTARSLGLRLAAAQAAETRAAGGVPVPLASLLTPHFLSEPERLFSEDHYHPSADGYALAAGQLLGALSHALGASTPDSSWEPLPETGTQATTLDRLNKLLRRRPTGVPAPVVLPAG